MIKITQIKNYDRTGKYVRCELYADDPTEFEEESVQIEGLPKYCELDVGSYCFTAGGDIGILDSDGVWNWME